MKTILIAFAALGSFAAWFAPSDACPQDPVPDTAAIQKAMQEARKYVGVGPQHEVLKRFLGSWNTEVRFYTAGGESPPERGKAEFSWLIDGRWLQSTMRGTMGGMQIVAHSWMGYDPFKRSFVSTRVTSVDNIMAHAEGDLTRDGKALITYGTIDEYLTGEHDKMVRYVWRFVSDDEIRLEVHDLPIGEEHTQVVGITYRRVD